VKAQVLILVDGVALTEARNLLWRRETRNEGSARTYGESGNQTRWSFATFAGLWPRACPLHRLQPEGKIVTPDPASLADAAISSVGRAAPGKVGISYLIGLLAAGIETDLTSRYVAEILSRTGASDLAGALRALRTAATRKAARWPKLKPP